MYQLVDMFALPEMTLYANVIQVSVHFSAKYLRFMYHFTAPFQAMLIFHDA